MPFLKAPVKNKIFSEKLPEQTILIKEHRSFVQETSLRKQKFPVQKKRKDQIYKLMHRTETEKSFSAGIPEADTPCYIGISSKRAAHILGVARKCYAIAKAEGFSEDFCRKMWLIGWCHDIGYEFSRTSDEHAGISAQMLENFLNCGETDQTKKQEAAILKHGVPLPAGLEHFITDEWRILNIADLTTDSHGIDVDVHTRLRDISSRYGENSDVYKNAGLLAGQLGIIRKDEKAGGIAEREKFPVPADTVSTVKDTGDLP